MAERKHIPKTLRTAVFWRDFYHCRYCRRFVFPRIIGRPEIDHITPVALGGTNRIGNLALSCRSCNRAKGTKPWWPRRLSWWQELINFILEIQCIS